MKLRKPAKTPEESLKENLNDFRVWLVATRRKIARPGYHLDLSDEKIESSRKMLEEVGTRSAQMLEEACIAGLSGGDIGRLLGVIADDPRTIFHITSRAIIGTLDPDDLSPKLEQLKEVP